MNINCERIWLKRYVCATIALFVYIVSDHYIHDSYVMKYSMPYIVLFMTLSAFSYLKLFNETITITRDDRYIIVKKGKKERKFAHNQQDDIRLIESNILANYDELIISLPKKQLRFVLSVYENDVKQKIEVWNSVKDNKV